MASKYLTFLVDQTGPFGVCDVDDTGAVKYYGFSRPDGAFYIQKEEVSGIVTTFRYVKGFGDYAYFWTNRAALTYDYFHEIFDA